MHQLQSLHHAHSNARPGALGKGQATLTCQGIAPCERLSNRGIAHKIQCDSLLRTVELAVAV